MGVEKICLEKAILSLPEASDFSDLKIRAAYKLSLDQLKALGYYDNDFGDIDGYEEISVIFSFEKDPMERDQKGWRHVLTEVRKKPFVRQY